MSFISVEKSWGFLTNDFSMLSVEKSPPWHEENISNNDNFDLFSRNYHN